MVNKKIETIDYHVTAWKMTFLAFTSIGINDTTLILSYIINWKYQLISTFNGQKLSHKNKNIKGTITSTYTN